MMRRLALTLILLALCGAAPLALAQTCTLTFTGMSFGTYSSAVVNATATGKVVCAGGWSIPMGTGTGSGATVTNRLMTGPSGATLGYAIYQNSARTTNWGNTTATEVTGTGNTTVTAYGQIPANQYPTPGTYTDTVDTATTYVTVTATVQSSCTVSATALAFGTYSGAKLTSTSTITATCTNTTPYNVGLNAGTWSGATVTTRKMTGPSSSSLSYSLYRDSAYSLNWGNTVGTDTLAQTGTGAAQSLTVYGVIPAGLYPTPGSYTDTITVTLTY